MVKKLFALASVTALTGVFAAGAGACSSETTTTTTASDGGGNDATTKKETGTPDEEDAGDTNTNCPANITFDEAAIEKELGSGFKAPAGIGTGACTQADITQLEKNFNDTNVKTFEDLKTSLSAGCVACAFTNTDAANWGPIVLLAADTTKGFGNFGACHAAVNDLSEACGKSFQYDQFCANAACGECSESQEQGCIGKVWGTGGACKDLHDSISTNCPKLTQSQQRCGNTLTQHVKVVCGDASGDAGGG